MSLANRFLPHSVKINSATGPVATWIDGIQGAAPDHGVSVIEEGGGSEIDREFVASREIVPTVPIETSDLSFIATCGMLGIPILPDSTHEGVTIYGRELPLGAAPTAIAVANHLKALISDGLIVPVSIRASHNQVAKLMLLLHTWLGSTPTYSGVEPMVWSSGQQIVSGAGATTKQFTCGPVKFDSVLVKGIQDIALTFGIQVFKEGDGGEVFQTHGSIMARDPKIEFSTRDNSLAAVVGSGLAISTSFAAYFRKMLANGQRVGTGTAQHISAVCTAGEIVPGATSLQYRRPGTSAFTFIPVKNTNILTLSATATIPTS